MKISIYLCALLFGWFAVAQNQQRQEPRKITLTGKVVDKTTGQPLEYTTVELKNNRRPDQLFGGVTDASGNFSIEVVAGVYDIKIEFISFKPEEIKQKELRENTNLGTIQLQDNAVQLEGVTLRAEKTTVEIKLDKKVYNVGQDLMVKGGSVSDVLDNVPSVSVDAEGTVSLRGNENVRILIDGRPSNAININDALRLIPADAIDKVEVITNPSARYDAEGGGGIINILLKKGKNQGINGTITATVGDPENYGLTGNINYKTENFNFFTTQGYNYRNSPGNALFDTQYLNPDGTIRSFIDERRENQRISEGYNGNFGGEWYLDKNTTWTNTVSYRKNSGDNPEEARFFNYDANRNLLFIRNRFNNQFNRGENIEYASNFVKNFKKDGHKLTADFSISENKDDDTAIILDDVNKDERTTTIQRQRNTLIQLDYVLPIKKDSRFEAGYRGSFINNFSDFKADSLNVVTNEFETNFNLSNVFEYIENVNALYTQFGSKTGKFSYLFGLRWEDSNIEVNQLSTGDFNNKRYDNFFPSAFLTYEITDQTNISLSYSRRIQRPRGRFLNPFQSRSSDLNIFQGNPNLDPSISDVIDLGFLTRFKKFTLSSSVFFNETNDVFQFVRRESGDFVNGVPVILSGPINLATEYRIGFEFNLNYTPYKWWRLNTNFNFFRNETQGEFTYLNTQNQNVTLNLDNIATGWTARMNSKVTLPLKIDWQTNATYNAPQRNFQGRSLGVFAMNLAFSKDVLKEKGTITLNVSDVFNSRKRINEVNLSNLNAYSEFQWRVRQINLSFTYRFNKQKSEKERPTRQGDGDGEFMG